MFWFNKKFKAKQRTAMVKLRLYEGTGDIQIKAPEGNFNILFFESLAHRLDFILNWI